MIDDVIEQWHQMDGQTDLDKQVNALITARMVLRRDVPADECVSYVEPCNTLWDATAPEESVQRIASLLARYFEPCPARCGQTAELYARLRAGEPLDALARTPLPSGG